MIYSALYMCIFPWGKVKDQRAQSDWWMFIFIIDTKNNDNSPFSKMYVWILRALLLLASLV